MKKKYLSWFLALFTVCSLSLTSCIFGGDETDENDEPEYPEYPEYPDDPDDSEPNELVSDKVPQQGWSWSKDGSILYFAPHAYNEGDFNMYFSFLMMGNKSEEAIVNIVTEDAYTAKMFAQMLNDGSWAIMGDDDDEDDYIETPRRVANAALTKLKKSKPFNINGEATPLPISVKCSGRVIYFSVPYLTGLSKEDLEYTMTTWFENEWTVDRVLFGKYENDVYTGENMYNLGIKYVVNTEYDDNGFCTKYDTQITYPSEGWGKFFYENNLLGSGFNKIVDQFGSTPEISNDGTTWSFKGIINGNVTKSQIDVIILNIDVLYHCPFLCTMFL